MLIKPWLRTPDNTLKSFLIIIPIVISQILQRLFPIIDNRYFNILGREATYLHNIQYNFVTLGQFIGLATYISILVFWRRKDCLTKQGNILIKHLFVSGFFTITFCIISWLSIPYILKKYAIDKNLYSLATMYLKIGLINMVIQAIFGGLDGILIGTQQQKYSMLLAIFILLGNWFADYYAVFIIYSNTYENLYHSVLLIGFSTTILLSLASAIALLIILPQVQGWKRFTFKDMLPVWCSELGIYLIRGLVPFILAWQFCFVQSTSKLLTTYQFVLHITYLFCFPLIAAMQIAIRDGQNLQKLTTTPTWWNTFFYTGFLPTTLLMILGIFFAVPLMNFMYGYNTPEDHIVFLSLFFISSLIGQIGNTLTISLRVSQKSYLVTKNFFIAELLIMLGGTQLLIINHNATSTRMGDISILFTLFYTLLNLSDVLKLNKTLNKTSIHENNN